ncbi:MAG: AraC family transcriptional regulator [Ruminococcaceae bacterium]|nr:AraC family transcriptional regulator [Oscillospiraceae bacterium]
MDIEPIQFDFPNLFFKLSELEMDQTKMLRDIHIHKAIEIIYVNAGCVECIVQDSTITLQQGDALLIHPLYAHRMRPLKTASVTYMQIDISRYSAQNRYSISPYFDEFVGQRFTAHYYEIPPRSELYTLVQKMKQEAIGQQKGFQFYLKGFIYELAAYINRYFMSDWELPEKYFADISAIVTYIEENYAAKLYLDTIARETGIDKFTICKIFKLTTGKTVVDYINFVRLQKAQLMLMEGEKNISETAFSCGFASLQYFNRVFKKYYACTPSQFWKSN